MKKTLLLMPLLFLAMVMLGQRTITGKVTDENKNPISNASVMIKESRRGVTTNTNGEYSIVVEGNARTLVISYVGKTSQEWSIGNKTIMNATLVEEEKNTLENVVAVGFGTKPIRENTGAISKVLGNKISNIPLPSFDQALAGKTAGLQITSTGGLLGDAVEMRVRGINSISQSSQPLVVIDGIPQIAITNLNTFNAGSSVRFNPLAMINAQDIESIEVLKDAAAAAIYGSRASNGVIIITTKKGKKGSVKVTVDAKYGFSRAVGLPDLLNGDDFIIMQNEKAVGRFGTGTANSIIARESDVNGDGVNDRTNWMTVLYRQAMTKDISLAMSGGTDQSNFYASARWLDQEGTSYKNRLKQGQARLNLDITPRKWFKSGLELSFSKTMNKGIITNGFLVGLTQAGWDAPPTVAVYNPAGPLGYNLTTTAPIGVLGLGNNSRTVSGTNVLLNQIHNVIAAVDLQRNNNTSDELRSNLYMEVQPLRGIKLTSKFGIQYIHSNEDQYNHPFIGDLGQPYNGLLQNYERFWRLWNWQNYITVDKTIANVHRISFVGGSDYQKNDFREVYTGAANFSDLFFQGLLNGAYSNVQPGTTTTLDLTGGNVTSSGIESYFARLGYSFKGKYFLEGALRRDSYSGFGDINKWGTFPSVSIGWELTKESFMSRIKFIDFLKIRGSYGKVGNSTGIGPYASRNLYGGVTYTTTTGLGNTQAGNAALRWESSNKLDVGVEANFLKNKIGLIVDYFKTDIDNLILNAPVLYTVGVPGSSISTNIGGMKNTGFEFTINATPISRKDFSWTSSFNFTTIKNVVKGLVPPLNADIVSGASVASVGKSLGVYYMPVWAGVDPANGNPMWYAADGTIRRYNFGATGAALWTDQNGVAKPALGTADNVYINGKQGLPKWYGGWDNTVTYKQIDLGVFISFQGGNYIYNTTRAALLSNYFGNNLNEIKERWTKPGDVTDIARLYLLDNTANRTSTRFLEKGDFIRVRTISLGYNFSKNMLNALGIDNLRIYGQVFNAFTFTKYTGPDPEVNANRFNNIAVGVDSRSTPQSRTFTFGIQASF